MTVIRAQVEEEEVFHIDKRTLVIRREPTNQQTMFFIQQQRAPETLLYPFQAVASVEDDGWEENIEEHFWVKGHLSHKQQTGSC